MRTMVVDHSEFVVLLPVLPAVATFGRRVECECAALLGRHAAGPRTGRIGPSDTVHSGTGRGSGHLEGAERSLG